MNKDTQTARCVIVLKVAKEPQGTSKQLKALTMNSELKQQILKKNVRTLDIWQKIVKE